MLKPVTALLPLEKMTIAEKLQAMEALWADLSRHEQIDSPAWHGEVLRQRADEGNFVEWEAAKKQLRARLK
jgi:hypothetical protein